MVWQTKVPAWVVPLVTNLVIPDSAIVETEVEFGKLGDSVQPVTNTALQYTVNFPGLVPEFRIFVSAVPTTNGINYMLKAYKGVGFYGAKTEVISYDNKKINTWSFPIDRKKFGFCSLSRNSVVIGDGAISYASQIHVVDSVLSLATNYDSEFDKRVVLNDVDKFTLNRFDAIQSPTVVTRVSFLPVWEVWVIKFFRDNNS